MSATILFTHDPLCFKCCSFKEELWYFETWAYKLAFVCKLFILKKDFGISSVDGGDSRYQNYVP